MRWSQQRNQAHLFPHERGTGRRLLWGLGLGAVLIAALVYLWIPSEPEKIPAHAAKNKRSAPPLWSEEEFNDSTVSGEAVSVNEEDLNVQEVDSDPLHILAKLKSKQTLFRALKAHQLAPERIQPVVTAMSAVFDFRRSRPGDVYEAHLNLDGNIVEFRYQTSKEDIYLAHLVGDRYEAEKVIIPKHMRVERVEGKLLANSSLYQSMAAIGEHQELARRFIDLFAYDFDFGNDSRPGDRFRLIVEKTYLRDEFYKYGRILAVEYQSGDSVLRAFLFDKKADDDKKGEYYDEEGRSLRRIFMTMPVKGARMTSGFTLRRFHPVYKRYRPHLGTDFAAPTGTPIMAIADGEITFRQRKGGNGNLVIIKHDQGYESLYAHLSQFNRRFKKGSKIRQKDVIGYVGTTGASTGPHLHLGVRRNGTYIDPLSVDTSRGDQLRGRLLRRFNKDRDVLLGQLGGKAPLPPRVDLTATPPGSESETGSAGKK